MSNLIFTHNKFNEPEQNDNLFYHYCSMETFVKIVENNNIWMRNLLKMNDTSELSLRNTVFSQKIYSLYDKNQFDISYNGKKNKEALKSYLTEDFVKTILTPPLLYTFLFALCLSEKNDTLSQWRMYGDNGKGVCLGFEKSSFNKIIDNDSYFLQKITYYKDIVSIENKVASDTLNLIKEVFEKNDTAEIEQTREDIQKKFLQNWARYKVDDYSHEEETRLVYKKESDLIFANVNNNEIPKSEIEDIDCAFLKDRLDFFHQISLDLLDLKSVTLGPLNKTDRESLILFLAKNYKGKNCIDLSKSRKPYRG